MTREFQQHNRQMSAIMEEIQVFLYIAKRCELTNYKFPTEQIQEDRIFQTT